MNQQENLNHRHPKNQFYPEYSSKNYAYLGYPSEEDFILYEQIAQTLSYDDSHDVDNLVYEDYDWAIRDISKAYLHEEPNQEYQGYYDGYQEGYHEYEYDPY